MSVLIHPCLRARELVQLPDDQLAEIFYMPEPFTVEDVRNYLKAEIAEGRWIVPVGVKCSEWSDTCGCRGHKE